jgi:hypothetical protein
MKDITPHAHTRLAHKLGMYEGTSAQGSSQLRAIKRHLPLLTELERDGPPGSTWDVANHSIYAMGEHVRDRLAAELLSLDPGGLGEGMPVLVWVSLHSPLVAAVIFAPGEVRARLFYRPGLLFTLEHAEAVEAAGIAHREHLAHCVEQLERQAGEDMVVSYEAWCLPLGKESFEGRVLLSELGLFPGAPDEDVRAALIERAVEGLIQNNVDAGVRVIDVESIVDIKPSWRCQPCGERRPPGTYESSIDGKVCDTCGALLTPDT